MRVGVQVDGVFQNFVRGDGFGALEARAETGAQDFVGDDQLEAGHVGVRGWVVGGVLGVNVDQLDGPIGVGAGGGSVKFGDDVTGDMDGVSERVGLPGENVGAMIDEALVLHQPDGPVRAGISRRNGTRAVWHGVGGIADVFVVRGGAGGGGVEGQAAGVAEI